MGKTYPRVVELLKKEFQEKKVTKYAFCKKTGINPTSVERYLHGLSEPSQTSLEKLSDYFGVTVGWLRGSDEDDVLLDKMLDEMILVFSRDLPKGGDGEGFAEWEKKMTDFIKKMVLYKNGLLASADEKTLNKVNDLVENMINDFVAKWRAKEL